MYQPNFMLLFVKNCRINDYFLGHAINELKLGYIIAEYLDPDSESKFKPNKEILNKLISPNHEEQIEAIHLLCEENNLVEGDTQATRETLEFVVPLYIKKRASQKEKKRIELVNELTELDSED